MAYSGQAKIAFDAGFYDALFSRPSDNPYNNTTKSYQAYDEGYQLGLLSDTPPRGPRGEQGDPGPAGPRGLNGTNGANGADGTQTYVGAGAPGAGLGQDNDTYIDSDSGDIYLKTGGSWVLQGNMGNVAQTVRTDTDGGSPETIYRGKALPGTTEATAAWRIERITIAVDGDVTIEFADGNDSFDNIWNNRASLSYS